MPWSTVEIRWFFTGSLEETGPDVEAWFRTRPRYGGGGEPAPIAWDPAPPAWREDRYLLVPGHDDMGIKWREGRLEIKGRESALGYRAFAPGIEGRWERWIKWSYAGERVAQRCLALFQGEAVADGVIRVQKRRLQRCIDLDAAGGGVEIGRQRPGGRGVNAELAQIRVGGSPNDSHWSLAFEAFPGDPQMSEPFVQVVRAFLDGCPALPLGAERSMAYPRWLRDLHRPARTSD